MTSFPLPKMSDVIGPIYSGYVPFRTVKTWRPLFSWADGADSFFFSRLRDCLTCPYVGSFRQTYLRAVLASEKINPRRVSNHVPSGSGNRTRIAELVGRRSPSVLAGPGKTEDYNYLNFVRGCHNASNHLGTIHMCGFFRNTENYFRFLVF